MNARPVGDCALRRGRGFHFRNRDRALAEERIALEPLVELFDFERDAGDLVDGIVAALRRRTVTAPTLHLDADLHATAMAAIDVHVRRFGNDDEFGFQLLDVEQVLPAKPVAVLFHHGCREINRELIVQAKFLDDSARVNHRGHAALLIHRPAPPNFPGLHERLERIEIPLRQVAGINRVHVAVEGDHAFALADAADDVAEAVNADSVEADLLHFLFDDGDDVLLLGGEGLGADQVGEKPHGVFLHRLGALPDQVVGDRGL